MTDLTIAKLHDWASGEAKSADESRRAAGRAVLAIIRERAELLTTDYLDLREALRRSAADRATLLNENARLRGLLNAKTKAPWEEG
jgi:hypothetical protein